MSEPKGPKLDLPADLVAEIEDGGAEGESSLDGEEHDAAVVGESHDISAEDSPEPAPDELAACKDRHLRLAAEFENFKRRALKERQDLLNFATEGLIKELLATIDNLERALGHVRQEEEVDKENLLEGVNLTFRSLMNTLEKCGVTVVEAEGQEFDPSQHEALGFQESAEHQEGYIVSVVRPGYSLNGRVLRPAQVILARSPEPAQ